MNDIPKSKTYIEAVDAFYRDFDARHKQSLADKQADDSPLWAVFLVLAFVILVAIPIGVVLVLLTFKWIEYAIVLLGSWVGLDLSV